MTNKLQATFREVACGYKRDIMDVPCPDKWFDVCQMRNSEGKLPYRDIAELDNGVRKIIIVLESPHVDEFEDENAPCPANGTTGRFLRSFWDKIFGNAYDGYAAVLVNAVQYQCSLGIQPIDGRTRDLVFQTLLDMEFFREDLERRISAIVASGDVILNACTMGMARTIRKLNNKEMVGQVLNKRWRCLDVYHPSSWMFQWKKVKSVVSAH